MKRVYLLCNAHLDPVWQWEKEEGMAEAISTFRIAAKFCEEYDGFIFNHNESVLYEWVEEHEPELFIKIKKLIEEGKWHIMGGWYIQPDCVMPSGESFLRQIEVGRNYFIEKFGIVPKTAINFDSFGHTRGLVQILKKCGYDSYLFMRPSNAVEETDFLWKGYDGSEIIGHRILGGYNTWRGWAVERIGTAVKNAGENEDVLVLWGIGNHGGGPSRIDLNKINEYIKSHPDLSVKHSFCEEYFEKVDASKLRMVSKSMFHSMIGCYTSMVRVKQMHRRLENELSVCEKMLAVSGVEYDKNQLLEAEKALLFNEFHDILPGTMIKRAESAALQHMSYGREIVKKYCTRAFFELCQGQPEGKEGEIPILVYNPHPYFIEQEIEVEFMLADQNWNHEVTLAKVRDRNGKYLICQNEKEDSMFHLDWRKRICFRAGLKPMSINRFDCELNPIPGEVREIRNCCQDEEHLIFRNSRMDIFINKKTGLLDFWSVDGIVRLNKDSGRINVYKDNEDPWGMGKDGFYDCIGEFEAVSKDEANRFNGYPEEQFENVRLIENGDVRACVQVIKKHANSYAIVTYTIPHHDIYIDVNIKILSNDVNVLYKLSFDTVYDGAFMGQSAFGREENMLKEEKEINFQKWCAITKNGKGFAVLNRGTYGGSARKNVLNITLMRTPIYTAHPIAERPPIADHDRSHNHIDMGEREFEFRLTCEMSRIDALAEMYNQPVYALSFFPSGQGEERNTVVELDSEDVILVSYKTVKDGILIRLFNSKGEKKSTILKVRDNEFAIQFQAYEVKTFIFNGVLEERNILGNEKNTDI